MALKEILVHATHGADCGPRLDAAARLAARFEARLTALYTLWIPPMPTYVEARIGRKVLEHQRSLHEENAESIRELFETTVSQAGVAGEWRLTEEPRVRALALQSRYCDLLVMGRDDDESPAPRVALADAVMLESPKPVLVVPDRGAPEGIGTHALVAWNGSREAVRAVDAALPLLQRADRVDVCVVDAHRSAPGIHGDVPGMDLCAHLARHGVNAEAQAVDSGRHGVGATLLERAAANGCDLIVLGAYGHARWREKVLGGVTDHALHHADRPMLMAH